MKFSRRLIICFGIIVFICGCKFLSDPVSSKSDAFFQSTGGFDYLRLPLIKPYVAIKGDDNLGWCIDLINSPSKDATNYISIERIEKISVQNEIILVYTSYKDEGAISLGQELLYWFVLIPDEGIEKGFTTEESFLEFIKSYDINTPNWTDPSIEFQKFEKTGCLAWFPNCTNLEK
jgi:hypothetical protein